MKHVHIVGPPRSGTTLMLELMITGFKFNMAVNREISLLQVRGDLPVNSTLCSKFPMDHLLIPYLLTRDANLWFISMCRDPRDVVVSRHGIHPETYWSNMMHWRSWRDSIRPFRGHPRLIEVRYEELSQAPDRVQQRISQRLSDLPLGHKFSEFHHFTNPSRESRLAMGETRPVGTSSVSNWKNHLSRIAGQIRIHGSITEDLVEFGYEADRSWERVLDGVPADTSPGVWPEQVSDEQLRLMRQKGQVMLRNYLRSRGLPDDLPTA